MLSFTFSRRQAATRSAISCLVDRLEGDDDPVGGGQPASLASASAGSTGTPRPPRRACRRRARACAAPNAASPSLPTTSTRSGGVSRRHAKRARLRRSERGGEHEDERMERRRRLCRPPSPVLSRKTARPGEAGDRPHEDDRQLVDRQVPERAMVAVVEPVELRSDDPDGHEEERDGRALEARARTRRARGRRRAPSRRRPARASGAEAGRGPTRSGAPARSARLLLRRGRGARPRAAVSVRSGRAFTALLGRGGQRRVVGSRTWTWRDRKVGRSAARVLPAFCSGYAGGRADRRSRDAWLREPHAAVRPPHSPNISLPQGVVGVGFQQPILKTSLGKA